MSTGSETTDPHSTIKNPVEYFLNADVRFEPRPQWAHFGVIHHRLAVALHFNHRSRLIGRLQRQTREPQRELVLSKLDLLPGLEQPRRKHLRLEGANGHNDFRLIKAEPLGGGCVPWPEMLMNIKLVSAAR